MQKPLEITFHNMNNNPKIEDLILGKFENVKKISPDVTKCHVTIEKLSKHHQSANRACVRIDLKVPRINDIIVSEKCGEDDVSLMSTVNKVFKRGKLLLGEEVARNRDRHRVPRDEKFEIEGESEEGLGKNEEIEE